MVDRAASQLKGKDIKYYKWSVYEVEVSTGDTITLDDYDSTVLLKQAWMANKVEGGAVTISRALNVVTIVSAGLTNVKCLLFVVGVKA